METSVNLDAGPDDPTAKVQGVRRDEEYPAIRHPERIGPFRVLRMLGEGGMGAVYLGEQEVPVQRQVALKVVHASLRSPNALARFAAERQALARLSHPNVAQLYEAGTTPDGFPYFAMEFMPGDTLGEYCRRKRLGIRERVALFVQVCQGVQHAHQKGLIHRDLKPNNLLVGEIGGQVVPKVIDFGIAKALDDPLTESGELTGAAAIGTPSYMSPEAFAAQPDLDTRTDVYSLGIVLYELLAGVRPNDLSGMALIRANAAGERPEPPRMTQRVLALDEDLGNDIAEVRGLTRAQLAQQLRDDLDWIVGRAIAEDRNHRYPTVADLAADLNRYLNNQAVEARPPSVRYRVGKFVRRHRVSVIAASLVLLALVLGIVGTTVGMLRAAREAEAARQVSGFLTRLFEVSDPGTGRGATVTARELLDQGAARIRDELKDQPIVQAQLLRTMGEVYQNLGLYAQAEPLEQAALSLRREAFGATHPDVGRSLLALGTVYSDLGRYSEARDLQQQALGLLQRELGDVDADVAEAQTQLGLTRFLLGDAVEAERLHRAALGTREALFGSNSAEVASSLSHIGYLLNNRKRYAEAEPPLQRALAIRKAVLGDDHYLVSDSQDFLGDLYGNMGRWDEAVPLYLESLAVKRKVYPPDHPLIAESQFSLGKAYAAQGKPAEARAALDAGIAQIERTLGSTHISLSRGLQELGMLHGLQGQWGEAEEAFTRLVKVYEAAVGPKHAWVGEALNNLGWVLSDGLHDYARAETVLRRALEIFPLEPDPGYSAALARWSLANCLRDAGRPVDAETYYAQAVVIMDGKDGPHPQLADLLRDYARALRASGRDEQAAQLEARLPAP
ncbi:MAG: serine/threonine protein kinase [Rhodanobacteraceae bacterium]|nr:serine/threonine protein kinase [Rhodanobacteraceae bacterium]